MDYLGQLLIAAPSLDDPNFHRTVVLMIDGDDSASIGVILNRIADKTVRDMWRDVFHRDVAARQPLRLGGPVFGPIIAIHSSPSLGEREVIDGVFASIDCDHINSLVTDPPEAFHLFIGHAGWSEGQLRSELDEGAWFACQATPEIVFGDATEVWQRSLQGVGQVLLASILHQTLASDPVNN